MLLDEHPHLLNAVQGRIRVRQGVTLVELLVVITLLLLVTSVTVPVIAPAIQQRRVREATRLVSSYFAAARARAMETGRPVGVMIEQFQTGLASATAGTAIGTAQNFSMNLVVAESPPPYAGDFTNSTVTVSSPSSPSYTDQLYVTFTDSWLNQSIRVGDAIRFGGQGMTYYFDAYNTTNAIYFITSGPSAATNPATTWSVGPAPYVLGGQAPVVTAVVSPGLLAGNPTSYQIMRQPFKSTAVAPLQLPEGIVIDLNVSGMSTQVSPLVDPSTSTRDIIGIFSGNASPIISFLPNGSVNLLYDNGPMRATGPIHLLLGRREQVPLQTWRPFSNNSTVEQNLTDYNSFWVTIGYQTGQVTVNENTTNNGLLSADVAAARYVATGASGAAITNTGGN